jgi:(p)ppGpp synthase/HD superfamily hydrolase
MLFRVAPQDPARTHVSERDPPAARWRLAGGPSFLETLPVATAALAFARERHAGQRRVADGAPFVLHPLEVAVLLHATGSSDQVVAAGLLHDVLEKTDAEASDIEVRCGRAVSELVEAVTEDPNIRTRGERKAALRRQARDAGLDAVLIFAADKVSKVRELRMRMASGRRLEEVSDKLGHYRASLAVAEEAAGGHPLVEQLRFELETLEALPPRRTAEETRR